MEQKLIDNQEKKRVELHLGADIAFIEYIRTADTIAYTHTEVPPALSGQGIGSSLAKLALTFAAENKLKVKPYCPFIKAYIDRHPAFQANSLMHSKKQS